MSYLQLSEGGLLLPGGLPPPLVVSDLRSCLSPIWVWLVNCLHLQPQMDGTATRGCRKQLAYPAKSQSELHAWRYTGRLLPQVTAPTTRNT